MKRGLRGFWVWMLLWPALATVVSFLWPINFLGSIFLFFIPLLITLVIALPQALPKAIIFSTSFSIGYFVIVDTIGHASEAWVAQTIFPRLFRLAPWEDLLLAVMLLTCIVMLYEFVSQNHRTFPFFHRRLLFFLVPLWAVAGGIALLWQWKPELLIWPYAYAIIGSIAAGIPVALELIAHRRLTGKFIRNAAYWSYALLLYEFAGVYRGWWIFPSHQYAGWISFGSLSFPLEELVFWIIMSGLTALAYYEILDDDNR